MAETEPPDSSKYGINITISGTTLTSENSQERDTITFNNREYHYADIKSFLQDLTKDKRLSRASPEERTLLEQACLQIEEHRERDGPFMRPETDPSDHNPFVPHYTT